MVSLPDPSLRRQAGGVPNISPEAFRITMIVGLTGLGIPLLIWLILHIRRGRIVRNLRARAWPGQSSREHDGPKKPDGTLSRGAWRTTHESYDWVFWDPDGEGQKAYEQRRQSGFLRYLPGWMRSSPHGSILPQSATAHEAIELEHRLAQANNIEHGSHHPSPS